MCAALLACLQASAQTFTEVEGNDSKAAANLVTLGPGFFNMIRGNSTSAAGVGLDYFRVMTTPDVLGIYKYTMTISTSGTAGHTGNIRGLNQVAAPAGPWPGPVGTPGVTDSTAQTHFIPAGSAFRVNTWYGFGKQEELYYRVTGTASTIADYEASFAKSVVTPTFIGSFNPGAISITTMATTTHDTDFWVYDGGLNAIVGSGNDDNSIDGGGTGVGLQGLLTRSYAPGNYYIAMSRFNLANDQGSPCDDDFRTGVMLDFPNGVTNSATTASATLLNFNVIDSAGTTVVAGPAHGISQHEVQWYSFRVVPEPGTLIALGLGVAALASRRRRAR
jgi:hypothetical protein